MSDSLFYFTDEGKKKEWENLDPRVKKTVISHLNQSVKMMTLEVAVDTLALVINDMYTELQELKKKINELD